MKIKIDSEDRFTLKKNDRNVQHDNNSCWSYFFLKVTNIIHKILRKIKMESKTELRN